MNGFDRLKEQVKDQKDVALIDVVDYLLSRDDLQKYYMDESKTIEDMVNFIQEKGKKHSTKNSWNYITNEVVYSWAVMYFSLPNEFLKIKSQNVSTEKTSKKSTIKNNVIPIEKAKEKITQLSLFGGAM